MRNLVASAEMASETNFSSHNNNLQNEEKINSAIKVEHDIQSGRREIEEKKNESFLISGRNNTPHMKTRTQKKLSNKKLQKMMTPRFWDKGNDRKK